MKCSTVTVEQARSAGSSQLHSISETARLDTDIILSEAISMHRRMLSMMPDNILSSDQQKKFESLLARRMSGEPIAYITGLKEFWSLELHVSPATLVPRPETELVVERTLAHCRNLDSPVIADLGTGCGAIALAIASELNDSRIIATDISKEALRVAQQNRDDLKSENVEFVQGDWTDTLSGMQMDVIAANPPYIREDDPCLEDIFMQHEPKLALTGGRDGLKSIRQIIESSTKYLKPGGWLVLEHGFDQETAVQELMRQNRFTDIRTFQDLAGLPRATEGCSVERL